jgi:hypothetical protein
MATKTIQRLFGSVQAGIGEYGLTMKLSLMTTIITITIVDMIMTIITMDIIMEAVDITMVEATAADTIIRNDILPSLKN